MLNREVFTHDPLTTVIPNHGVAKVMDPSTPEEWEVLRYELTSFVCDGAYRRGLERILNAYLTNLNQPEQPAAWVSGFYGSGKSHLLRVLEYLWQDIEFPDGARARGLANLPDDMNALLVNLSTEGRRRGGLWSAAGRLGSGAGSVRLALLAIVFAGAGLPEQYQSARFVIWLRQNGYDAAVVRHLATQGKELMSEVRNLYVSPLLAAAVAAAVPDFPQRPAEVLQLLRAQYPANVTEISNDDMTAAIGDVLALQSAVPGKIPGTLLVFDELQQFIGDDNDRTRMVQDAVEVCSARFGADVMFVAAGQLALQATPQLQKLMGRFTIQVGLEDTDVQKVIREVVLQKQPDKVPAVQAALEAVRGEIDRQLAGSKIAATGGDAANLVADYPLLPVRRRFWEAVLRGVDTGGFGQLRTQLRIVHETTRELALQPLGMVIPADAIYPQLQADMLSNGTLLREVANTIAGQDDGTPDGRLRSRLCAAIFLVSKISTEGIAAVGIRASADTLADLLVEDLGAGSASLRQRIPDLLRTLVDAGTIMLVHDEYRLQTVESAEWTKDFLRRQAQIANDDGRIAESRNTELRAAIANALRGLTFQQGASKVTRKFELYFESEPPALQTGAVPVWVRDEWSASERAVREEAQRAGTESPIVFLFIPRREPSLKDTLAAHAAADECIKLRPIPSSAEGNEARAGMESRRQVARAALDAQVAALVRGARIYQGGGNEVNEGAFAASVRTSIEAAIARLFPQFPDGDHPGWPTALKRAVQGNGDPLTAVGYSGEPDKQPVCADVLRALRVTGTRGAELRKQFAAPPYGWPQDAIDGALLTLVAAGLVRAERNGQAVEAKAIQQQQIGVIEFKPITIIITTIQRIGIRGLLTTLGVTFATGEEAGALPMLLERLQALAREAGGDPPLPERADARYLGDLLAQTGNERFVAVWEQRDRLLSDWRAWTTAKNSIAERLPRWQLLERLLQHARPLPIHDGVALQAEAIRAGRSLLTEPDPVPALLEPVAAALREELQTLRGNLDAARRQSLSALGKTQAWQTIKETQRDYLLKGCSLDPVPPLQLGTNEDLLRSLDTAPLDTWQTRIDAVATQADRAREEAAKLLVPKAKRVYPPPGTLQTREEVVAYLERWQEELLRDVEAGTPVIV